VLTPFSVGPRQFGQFAETTVAHAIEQVHTSPQTTFAFSAPCYPGSWCHDQSGTFKRARRRVSGTKEKPPGTLSGARRLVAV
jgi:hypothetical protein